MKIDDGRAERTWRAGLFAPLIVFAALTTPALTTPAAAQSFADYTQTQDPLFQRRVTRPSDLGNTQAYAAGASAQDIEAAIGAYEQLLFYNPKLARTRFELGVLYFRLGSYEMARSYLESALAMPDMPPELRHRAQDLIDISTKKLFPDQFTGFVQTGLRYQTNASVGPGSQAILASGFNYNNRFAAQADANWFGAFGLNYVHDFENQYGTTFEASAIGYDAQQFTLHQYDVGLLEVRAGPRFGFNTGTRDAFSVKPYLVAAGATLANAAYYGGLGGGLTVHRDLGAFALDPYVEVVQQSFRNSTFYPLASGLSGTLTTVALQASGPLYGGIGFQTKIGYGHDNANFNPYGYNVYGADLALPWNFSFPGDGRLWTLTPIVGVSYWQYAAPDPTIDPATTPHTTEWRAGVGLDIPIWRQIALGTLVQYRADVSNIPAFTMKDWQFSAGPTFRF